MVDRFLGNTALILSVTRVKENVIRNRLIVLLLQGGADPNGSDRHGFTPLMHGILLRHIDSVRLLSDSVILCKATSSKVVAFPDACDTWPRNG